MRFAMKKAMLLGGYDSAAPVEERAGPHPLKRLCDARADTDAVRRRVLVGSLVLMAGALWLLTRHYNGAQSDSRIYLGRALADLSPLGVGRDLMFVHDGQSPFSLFPVVMRVLVQHLGAPVAGTVIALTGIGLWFGAFAALAFRLAPGRTAWAMLMFVAVLPAQYGGLSAIAFGEALAIPRPFSEAAVLAALWAVLDGRRAVSLGFLVVAGLIHPIMALCGVGVVVIMLGLEDRRWFAGAGALAALTLIAAVSGLPLADRLFHRVDPSWLDLLRGRSRYLFPCLWPLESWSRAGVQLATVLVGAMALQGRARGLFLAVALVAIGGVALSFVGGDLYPSLLLIQVQSWRALWLVAAFAAGGAAVCVAGLWDRGPSGHVTLALLGLSWLMLNSPYALTPAVLAVGVQIIPKIRLSASRPGLARACWLLLLLRALYLCVVDALTLPLVLNALPADVSRLDILLRAFCFHTVLIIPLVVWLIVTRPALETRMSSFLTALVSLFAIVLVAILWNQAPTAALMTGPDRRLVDMIKSRPGEVQWINGDTQAWALADRPAWGSELQGASIVFGRDAALIWQTRIRRLLALHLVGQHALTPWKMGDPSIVQPSSKALTALCASSGGPAWIVSPILKGQAAPPLADVKVWRAPYVSYLQTTPKPTFAAVDTYAVIPCGAAPSRPATSPPPPAAR